MAGCSPQWAGTLRVGWVPRGCHKTRLEKEIAGDLQGWPRRTLIHKFRAQLTFASMAFIAKQLRAAEEAIPQDDITSPPNNPPFQGGNLFEEKELAGWETVTEETVFIGPIRRGIRITRERPSSDHSVPPPP